MNKSSFALKAGVGLALIFPLLAVLAIRPYFIPGPDETYQVQAASQILLGNGYVSGALYEVKDLSKPVLGRAIGWPISYSLTNVALQSLGLSQSTACKTFEIFLILIGVVGWAALLEALSLSLPICLLVLPLLWIQFSAWGIYATNGFSWALHPLLFLFALRIEKGARYALLAGLACMLLVAFRYQNLTLIPAGCLAILLSVKGTWFQRCVLATVYALPPSLLFLAIFLNNRAQTGHGTFLTAIPLQIGFEVKWVFDFFAAFFLGAFMRLDEMVFALGQKIGLGAALKYSVALAVALGAGLLLVKGFKRKLKRGGTNYTYFIWVMVSTGCLVALLFAIAILQHIENIPVGRYYHPYFALFAVLLVVLWASEIDGFLRRLGQQKRRALIASLWVLCGAILVGFSAYRFRLSKNYEARAALAREIVGRVMSEHPGLPVLVFVDQVYPSFAPRRDLTTLVYPDLLRQEAPAPASAPVLVFVVHDEANPKPQYPPIDDIRKIASRQRMKVEEASGLVVAWKQFGAKP